MAELDKVLYNLVEPMVDDKDSLRVEKETREGSDEVVLRVYAKNGDIASGDVGRFTCGRQPDFDQVSGNRLKKYSILHLQP